MSECLISGFVLGMIILHYFFWSVQPTTFGVLTSLNGSRLCSEGQPYRSDVLGGDAGLVSGDVRSCWSAPGSVRCGWMCTADTDCVGFNFNPDSNRCDLFDERQSVCSIDNNCSHFFQVKRTDLIADIKFSVPQNCDFPFTYLGQLYYKCISNVANVTNSCYEMACLTNDRKWALCWPGKYNYLARNETVNITISQTNETVLLNSVSGWIVVQQKIGTTLTPFSSSSTPRASFNQSWSTYKSGFGEINSNFWIGLDRLHYLTAAEGYTRLRIEVQSSVGGLWFSAEYSQFRLANESQNYQFDVSGYSGDAGNSFKQVDGAKFSTFNRENDNSYSTNCASSNGGGWWYLSDCTIGSLNTDLKSSFKWTTLTSPLLSTSRMMIQQDNN